MSNKSFWITNISNRNVSLADLNLTIKAFSSINLLDNRHYKGFTLEQLQASATYGSIFNKNKIIKVRQVAPEIVKNNFILSESYIPSRERSVFSIKEEKYEELDMTDEEFAKENADFIEEDIKPVSK